MCIQATVEGKPILPEISRQAVLCHTLSTLWQLHHLLRDESLPPPEWGKSVVLFREQLEVLTNSEDLRLRSAAVRALADLYLIFQPATFKVCLTTPLRDTAHKRRACNRHPKRLKEAGILREDFCLEIDCWRFKAWLHGIGTDCTVLQLSRLLFC